jgi:hypothetical protein
MVSEGSLAVHIRSLKLAPRSGRYAIDFSSYYATTFLHDRGLVEL